MQTFCTLHQKPTKFVCNSPCSSLFCTECIPYHRNHIIRDLITFPLDPELSTLTEAKQTILKSEQHLLKNLENSQKLLKELEESQTQSLSKVDEDYKNVQKVLSERVKTVKNEIILKNSQEKLKINKFIEDCQRERQQCINKLQTVEVILRSRPDYILNLTSLLDPYLSLAIRVPSLPKLTPADFPLLRSPGTFFESI